MALKSPMSQKGSKAEIVSKFDPIPLAIAIKISRSIIFESLEPFSGCCFFKNIADTTDNLAKKNGKTKLKEKKMVVVAHCTIERTKCDLFSNATKIQKY